MRTSHAGTAVGNDSCQSFWEDAVVKALAAILDAIYNEMCPGCREH